MLTIQRSAALAVLGVAALLSLETSVLQADEAAAEARPPTIDFEQQVRPLLAQKCIKCHGPEQREGGLRFTSRADALLRNDSGLAAIVPGKSGESELIRRVSSTDDSERMPPEGPRLSDVEVNRLRSWIDQGAAWPEPKAALHWAYMRPARPKLPQVNDASWPKNAIDHFVLARLEREGLAPSPPADRARLLRRVYLDLIGLPPTVEEVDAFLSDPRPDAYEQVVDDLLASPHYGERWARPWLDLARYADSNGFQRDGFREVWAYRDWVINAFNADMPFDRFTIEQIAGDLLPEATLQQRIATGFHRCPTVNVEAGTDQEENRVNAVVDRVNTTATVWLGTTLACAQCHNHKYDPFSQQDYYQLLAYFNNTEIETSLRGAKETAAVDFIGPWIELPDANLPPLPKEVRLKHDQLQGKLDELTEELADGQDAWEESQRADEKLLAKLPAGIRRIVNLPAEKRNENQAQQLANYYLDQQPEIKKLRAELAPLAKQLERKPPSSLVMSEMDEPRMTHIFKRGNFLDHGTEVQTGVPEVLHPLPADSEPNRLGLARWLVDPNNPLVGRVTVNRWWAELFGDGLVASEEDFGTQGEPPTHPELLDWLATEFTSHWSTKQMHRLIVTSATYRQSSKLTPKLARRDPQNRLYARGPRVRLAAEAIRDNGLAISGLLSPKLGGPPVFPPQPEGLWRVTGLVDNTYRTSTGADAYRRGVYVIWRRSAPYASFVNFDATDRASCVVQRSRTNTPLQALTLMNDPVYVEMAQSLALRILREAPSEDESARVEFAFRTCLARSPSAAELNHLLDVYRRELARFQSQPAAAAALFGKGKLPPGLDVQKAAAWFYVANILLNLDETITKG
jgi:cytochrome c553